MRVYHALHFDPIHGLPGTIPPAPSEIPRTALRLPRVRCTALNTDAFFLLLREQQQQSVVYILPHLLFIRALN